MLQKAEGPSLPAPLGVQLEAHPFTPPVKHPGVSAQMCVRQQHSQRHVLHQDSLAVHPVPTTPHGPSHTGMSL